MLLEIPSALANQLCPPAFFVLIGYLTGRLYLCLLLFLAYFAMAFFTNQYAMFKVRKYKDSKDPKDMQLNLLQKVLIFTGCSQFELFYHPRDRILVKKIRLASMTLFLTSLAFFIHYFNALEHVVIVLDGKTTVLTNTCSFQYYFICTSTAISMIANVCEIVCKSCGVCSNTFEVNLRRKIRSF